MVRWASELRLPRLLVALSVLGTMQCRSGGSGDYLGAAVTAAAAVAAAAMYREASGGCWASCSRGERCDADSGLCVAAPCRASCKADHRCMWVEGAEQCVPPHAADRLEPVADATTPSKQTKQWLCYLAGISDCPEPPHRHDPGPDVDIVSGLDVAAPAPDDTR
jgi:hypothetical protein